LYDIITSSYQIVNTLYNGSSFEAKQVTGLIGNVTNAIKALCAKWDEYSSHLQGTVCYNYETSQGDIFGHPDVICDTTVLDIKTTSSFKSMSHSSFLQVLAYYALMKPSHSKLENIGFILPNQREIIIFNVAEWDYTKFLDFLLQKAIDRKIEKEKYFITTIGNRIKTCLYIEKQHFDAEGKRLLTILEQSPDLKIGHCTEKGTDITKTMKEYIKSRPGCPVQFAMRSMRSGKINPKTYDQVKPCAKVINNSGLQCFIHAAYVVNLCANAKDAKTGKCWSQEYLNDDLKLGNQLGCKGVVVHLGNKTTQDEELAIDTMEHMVREALKFATPECPLLIETGCGEKGEVCYKLEQLGLFLYRFNETERQKLGICCDSCHLLASGQDPQEFMQLWETLFDIPIKLIHFNDSKTPFNSHVDRHARFGKGHLGYKKMLEIAIWATERNIPLVIE
jgi:deoxyribonuclease-4